MSYLIRLTLKLFWLLVIISVLYVVAYFVDMLPDALMPAKLFGKNYAEFKADVAKDAKQHNSTSEMSKKLYQALDDADHHRGHTAPADNSEAGSSGTTQTNASATPQKEQSPTGKTQAAVQEYNDSVKKEQEELNKY